MDTSSALDVCNTHWKTKQLASKKLTKWKMIYLLLASRSDGEGKKIRKRQFHASVVNGWETIFIFQSLGPIITGSVQLCYKNKEPNRENCLESHFVLFCLLFLFTENLSSSFFLHRFRQGRRQQEFNFCWFWKDSTTCFRLARTQWPVKHPTNVHFQNHLPSPSRSFFVTGFGNQKS